MAMDGVTINHSHVFLQGCVHESDSILAELIISWNIDALLSKPLDLVFANTVSSNFTHASPFAIFEEPDSWHLSFKIWRVDGDIIS